MRTPRSMLALAMLCFSAAGCSSTQTAANSDVATSTTEEASLVETTTTVAELSTASTTVASTAAQMTEEGLCATLDEAGLETRRAALADVSDDTSGSREILEAARAMCGEAIERVEGANTIIERNDFTRTDPATGEIVDFPFVVDDFGCEAESFYGTVTHTGSWPVGVTVYSEFTNGADEVIRTSDVREVIWSLAPGETVRVEGPHTEIRGAYVTCSVFFGFFDADTTEATGALAVAHNAELTGDDPTQWLPALLERTQETFGAADPDLFGAVYDIRSGVIDASSREFYSQQLPRAIGPIALCATDFVQPDPDRIILVWEEDRPEHTAEGENGPETIRAEIVLHHGVFRRGPDGQWRWLATVRQIQAADGEGCASVGLEVAG